MSIKISKRYAKSNGYQNRRYFVTMSILNDKGISPICFLDSEGLVDNETPYININNLNNETFLKEKGIEYIKEIDNSTNEIKIIPVGLVDLEDSANYRFTELLLWNHDGKDLYKTEKILENIEKAIKMKYESVKFITKCSKVTQEFIPLDD